MPWCARCDRFLSPSTVTVDGTCPRCGGTVDAGRASAPVGAEPSRVSPDSASRSRRSADAAEPTAPNPAEEPLPLPWHFKLLVGAITVYLGWRAFQGIEWLVHRL